MSFDLIHQPAAAHKCGVPGYDTFTYGTIVQCRDCQRYYILITGWYGGPSWSEVSRLRHPFLYRRLKR